MPCLMACCYAMLFPLLSSLLFFTQSAGWRGRESGYWSVNILPEKEWTWAEMRCFPALTESLWCTVPLTLEKEGVCCFDSYLVLHGFPLLLFFPLLGQNARKI